MQRGTHLFDKTKVEILLFKGFIAWDIYYMDESSLSKYKKWADFIYLNKWNYRNINPNLYVS
jgi:hypothetical protein